MASAAKSGKADVVRNREVASRLSYLRNTRYVTEGFAFHDNPSVEEARSMANRNRRRVLDARPTPSARA